MATKPDIIKEYCPAPDGGSRFILRLPHYAHNLTYILQLWNTAQEDFRTATGPLGLNSLQVEVVHYGGKRHRGTYGIEFNLKCKPPEDYLLVGRVEDTL